jgi:molybdate transport system substrate-binding protein
MILPIRGMVVLALALLACPKTARSQTETPIVLFAAGSLRAAVEEIAAEYQKSSGVRVLATFGPSGLLRERIEHGERPDIFASADMASPRKLAEEGLGTPATPFTANEVCAVAPRTMKLSAGTLLDVMLSPAVAKIGAGTPVADPLGDYTEAIFANADGLHPGAKKLLDDKAVRLIGGRDTPKVPAGQDGTSYFLLGNKQVDLMLTYCSGAQGSVSADPRLELYRFPANLAVSAGFGYTIVKGAKPQAADLGHFLQGTKAQEIFLKNGFRKP